jgi:hypothetical protein
MLSSSMSQSNVARQPLRFFSLQKRASGGLLEQAAKIVLAAGTQPSGDGFAAFFAHRAARRQRRAQRVEQRRDAPARPAADIGGMALRRVRRVRRVRL